jgi:cell division protein FtsL
MSADGWAALLLMLVTLSAVGAVYSKHLSRDQFVELQARQQERDELDLEWGRLQLEQSTIADIAVVDYAARMRLRMAVPDHADVIYVRP